LEKRVRFWLHECVGLVIIVIGIAGENEQLWFEGTAAEIERDESLSDPLGANE
jgi:hypothetical protein